MVCGTLIPTSLHTQTILTSVVLFASLWSDFRMALKHPIRNSLEQRWLPYHYCSFLHWGQTSLINCYTLCYHVKTRPQILSIKCFKLTQPIDQSWLVIKPICHACPFKYNCRQQLRGENRQWVVKITANIYWALILLHTLCAWAHLILTWKHHVIQILFLPLFYK